MSMPVILATAQAQVQNDCSPELELAFVATFEHKGLAMHDTNTTLVSRQCL